MDVRKDILELHFHKYLTYKITIIIIFFTSFIALLIPFLTGQLEFSSVFDISLIVLIFSIFIILIISYLNKFDYHLRNILEELKKLK